MKEKIQTVQLAIKAALQVFEVISSILDAYKTIFMYSEILKNSHQQKCKTIAHVMSKQSDPYTKQILWNYFKKA